MKTTAASFAYLKTGLVLAALGTLFNSSAYASSGTWLNTGTTASWSSTGNWTGGVIPGAAGGSTTNTDVALFNTAVDTGTGTVGAKTTPITIDTGRNIGGITFDTGAGNFFIGVATGTPLLLTSGGTILMTSGLSTQVETIQAPLIIEGANGTYTFNSSTTGAGGLVFTGAISGSGAGTTVLTLTGTSTALNNIASAIGNGSTTSFGIDKEGVGTWELTGTNTYTGATTVNGGLLEIGNNATGSISSSSAVTIGANGTLGLNMGSGVTLGSSIIDNGAIVANQTPLANVNTLSGNISGSGSVAETTLATLALTGSNSYTGQTLISNGFIQALDGTGLSSSSLLNLANGTLETSGNFTRTLGGLGGAPGANVELTGGISGFSANGAPLLVSLGGIGTPSTLVWGTSTFNPGALVLNDSRANAAISFENNIDFNGNGGSILVGANTASLDGAVTSTGGGGSLSKLGAGTLILTNANNTYSGGTYVGQGVLSVGAASSIGAGGATVYSGGELRSASTSNIASGQKVLVNQGGVFGFSSNGYNQAALASVVDPKSAGILAIDSTSYNNALDMSQLGNGAMFLGSSTTGVYGASTLGIAAGGTDTVSAGLFQQFGSTYQLGGGGGTLVLTGSNVLTDLTPSYIATNPNNALGTSNTRNSVTVGSVGGNGSGTLDLANNQSYTGLTKVNVGSTLDLDFSGTFGTPSSNTDILAEGNEIDLSSGTLNVIGSNSAAATSQTLANVNMVGYGGDTIMATQNTGNGALTLNLGVVGGGTAGGQLVANDGGVLIAQGGTAVAKITTTTASNASDSSGPTFGGAAVYQSAPGTYSWATGTANGDGTYTIGGLGVTTGTEATLATGTTSGTTDYILKSGTFTAASGGQAVNLLHLTGGSIAGSTTAGLVVNGGGILFTGTAAANLGNNAANSGLGWLTSGATNSAGYDVLNLWNYTTGGVFIGTNSSVQTNTVLGDNGSTKMTVVYGGTGVYTFGLNESYSGGSILNGATLNMGENSGAGAALGTGTLIVNSGTLEAVGGGGSVTSGIDFNENEVWNGNLNFGATASTGAAPRAFGLGGSILLGNNVIVTQAAFSNFSLGNISDNGMGYSLTFNIAPGSTTSLNGTAGSFGGPFTAEGGGQLIINAGSLNRNNIFYLGAGTTVNSGGNANTGDQIAGLDDLNGGASNATEVITRGVGSGSGSANFQYSIWGSGTYSFGGLIEDAQGTTSGNRFINLAMDGTGTQILTGSNNFAGGLTANAGTLEVDASKGGLVQSQTLALGGGTYDFKGATTGSTETLGAVTVNAGGSSIVVDNNGGATGATVLHLGSFGTPATGSMLDFNEKGSLATITTSSAVAANTPYTSHIVYTDANGNVTWATGTSNTGAGVGTYTIGAYTGDTTALVSSGGASTTNYMLSSSQTLTSAVAAGDLRVTDTNSGTDVLDMAGKNLTLNSDGLLDNGSAAYTITDSVGGGILTGGTATGNKELDIWNFSKGGLTINATIGNNSTTAIALSIGGTGLTTLTGTNTYSGLTYLNGGTVNFNSMANFGTGTGATGGITFGGGALQYAEGNTADLSSSGKNVVFNAAGGGIDTNGNNITFAAISFGTGIGGMTVSDSTGTGVLNFKSNSAYTGNTTIQNGGHLNLSGSLAAGNSTIVGSGGLLTGGTTQQTSVAQTISSNAGKLVLMSGGVIAPGDMAGGLNITGRGVDANDKGDQATGSTKPLNNVLNATNLTWNAGGTLKFQLDNTILPETFGPGFGQGPGPALDPSASTTLNLGTGSLVKVAGTGKFTLDFQNTGAWDTNFAVNGDNAQNVYDLINFGATNLAGVITPNTNFNIDDFSIVGLNGVGTLSFYYNAYADGGLGQEELLLTVIPEPSTWAMLVGGLITLVFWTRRRRAASAKSK